MLLHHLKDQEFLSKRYFCAKDLLHSVFIVDQALEQKTFSYRVGHQQA
jgi:hypothetical protein